MDCLVTSDSPASSPESSSGSSGRDSEPPERSPSPPPSIPTTTITTTTTTTITSTMPSRKRVHDPGLEERSPNKKRRTEGPTLPESHILTGRVRLSPPEGTDPERPNPLDVRSGCRPSSQQLQLPASQTRNDAAMELVFVYESGHPDFDGASETSEESCEDDNDNEDEWNRGHIEISSPHAGKCSTSRGCVLPVDEGPPTSEVSSHLQLAIPLPTASGFSFWACHALLK